jgi:hypothetical protein
MCCGLTGYELENKRVKGLTENGGDTEVTGIDEILNSIGDAGRLKENVKGFITLSAQEKVELLGALRGVKTETTGRFLSLAYPEEKDVRLQKLMRTLLFRLKTQGIHIEEPREAEEPVLRKIEVERAHKGFMSNYDPEGTRLVMAVFEGRKNNFALFHAITHFSQGLLELTTAPVDRRNMELIVQEFADQTKKPFVFVEISARYATHVIEEASARSGKYVEQTAELHRMAAHVKNEIQRPGDLSMLPIPDDTKPLSLEQVLQNGIFASFAVAWDTLDQDKKEYEGIGTSSIILPPHMMEEKKQDFIKTVLDRSGMRSRIPLMKRMMEDYGYILYQLKLFEAYRGLMDTSKEAWTAEKAFLYYVRKSLEKMDEKQPGLIVSPYEPVRR